MKNLTIIRIPRWSRALLGRLPKWKETNISGGRRIVRHSHLFLAIYFTFGVTFIETEVGPQYLPEAAMVVVPPGQVHGWATETKTSASIVGHFHQGHGAHATESFGAPV